MSGRLRDFNPEGSILEVSQNLLRLGERPLQQKGTCLNWEKQTAGNKNSRVMSSNLSKAFIVKAKNVKDNEKEEPY